MSSSNPFIRKIIYIAAIGGLLIPLSLVSRPETRNGSGDIEDGGGKLSQLREEYSLSQAKLAEIDPASETMKLASLGLRGVAVNMLWMQAMEHKKTENYDQLASTLKALTKIQPSFVKVWEFQAHNLAYNVSMEFDDYEYRYHWVKKGIGFLKEGVPYNKTDHRMTDNLGFFTGNKMGKSDEKDSFRRMFRQDDEFHQSMADYIDPESYDERGYGPDSWKMAYMWYDYSRKLVEEQSCPQRTSDMMFFMKRPAQLRNQASSLQKEFRTDEIIQEIWRSANEEWLDYGKEPISNTLGITVTLDEMGAKERKLEKLRDELDAFAPGVRKELVAELVAQTDLTGDQLMAWNLPVDERTDEQIAIARRVNEMMLGLDAGLDDKVAAQATSENQMAAKRLASDIRLVQREIQTIDKDSTTINYIFWKARTAAESEELAVLARQALYDAEEMRRRSIYDDEFDRDYKTKEVTITKQGAISLYLDAYEKWQEVLTAYPELEFGGLANELVDSMKEFEEMLTITNRQWPREFPMQATIDRRGADGEPDELPTSEQLAEMWSATEEERQLALEAKRTKAQQPPPSEPPKPVDPNVFRGNLNQSNEADDMKAKDKKADDKKADDGKAADKQANGEQTEGEKADANKTDENNAGKEKSDSNKNEDS